MTQQPLSPETVSKAAHAQNERNASELASVVRAVVDRVLVEEDVFVVDLVCRGSAEKRVIEVFVDSQAHLNVDQLASISRRVAKIIETEDLIQSAYRLDVSSPGAERPLTDIRQYGKHVGRPLLVRHGSADSAAVLQGILHEVTPSSIVLEVDGSHQSLPVHSIIYSTVLLPW